MWRTNTSDTITEYNFFCLSQGNYVGGHLAKIKQFAAPMLMVNTWQLMVLVLGVHLTCSKESFSMIKTFGAPSLG